MREKHPLDELNSLIFSRQNIEAKGVTECLENNDDGLYADRKNCLCAKTILRKTRDQSQEAKGSNNSQNMSKEDIETAHKKALKSLEGEKRAAIKKAKGIKGKKGKAALAAAEEEFAAKLKALEASYQDQLAALAVGSLEISSDVDAEKPAESNDNDKPAEVDEEALARARKLAKAKKKRDKQKEKEARIEQEIEEANANAGPGLRKIELEQIQTVLTPLKLKVDEVDADGHCMYRAVAAQAGKNYMEIRKYRVQHSSYHEVPTEQIR